MGHVIDIRHARGASGSQSFRTTRAPNGRIVDAEQATDGKHIRVLGICPVEKN